MLDREEGPGGNTAMASPQGRRVDTPPSVPRAALAATFPEGRAPVALSAREAEVLLWIARGASNNEIAQIVSLSPHTVDTYCRRVLSKFETSSRTTAAVRAAQAGLLPRV